jgi:hypothetical protein
MNPGAKSSSARTSARAMILLPLAKTKTWAREGRPLEVGGSMSSLTLRVSKKRKPKAPSPSPAQSGGRGDKKNTNPAGLYAEGVAHPSPGTTGSSDWYDGAMDDPKLERLRRLARRGEKFNDPLPERIQRFAPWTWDPSDQIAVIVVALMAVAFMWEAATGWFSRWISPF